MFQAASNRCLWHARVCCTNDAWGHHPCCSRSLSATRRAVESVDMMIWYGGDQLPRRPDHWLHRFSKRLQTSPDHLNDPKCILHAVHLNAAWIVVLQPLNIHKTESMSISERGRSCIIHDWSWVPQATAPSRIIHTWMSMPQHACFENWEAPLHTWGKPGLWLRRLRTFLPFSWAFRPLAERLQLKPQLGWYLIQRHEGRQQQRRQFVPTLGATLVGGWTAHPDLKVDADQPS